MSTGIVAFLNGVGSVSYTAPSNAKMIISATALAAGPSVTVNSIPAIPNGVANYQIALYVGAGQTVTLATNSATSVIASVLEES